MPLASSTQQEYLHAMCCQRQFSCVSPRLFSSLCCHCCETSEVSCVCSHSVRNPKLLRCSLWLCYSRLVPGEWGTRGRGYRDHVAQLPPSSMCCVKKTKNQKKASPQAALQMTCAVSPWLCGGCVCLRGVRVFLSLKVMRWILSPSKWKMDSRVRWWRLEWWWTELRLCSSVVFVFACFFPHCVRCMPVAVDALKRVVVKVEVSLYQFATVRAQGAPLQRKGSTSFTPSAKMTNWVKCVRHVIFFFCSKMGQTTCTWSFDFVAT